MKKINKFMTTIIAMMIAVSVSAIPASAKELPDSAFINIGGAVNVSAGTSAEERACAMNAYNLVPQHIRSAFEEKGVMYMYTPEEDNSMPAKWGGFCVYPDMLVLQLGGTLDNVEITGAEELGKYTIELNAHKLTNENGQTLIHEMGHFVDKTYKGGWGATGLEFSASDTGEFGQIANAEKNALANVGLISKYNVYCTSEIFAEGFACLYIYPDKMAKSCPQLTAYISNVIATYGSGGPVTAIATAPPVEVTQNVPAAEVPTAETEEAEEVKEVQEATETVAEPVEEVKEVKPAETVESEPAEASAVQTSKPHYTHRISYGGYTMDLTEEEAKQLGAKLGIPVPSKEPEQEKDRIILIPQEPEIVEELPWYTRVWNKVMELFG